MSAGKNGSGYEFITIERLHPSPSGKTNVYRVVNNRSRLGLGEIRWMGAWRQYVFYPGVHTVYSAGCLRDLADFLSTVRSKERAA